MYSDNPLHTVAVLTSRGVEVPDQVITAMLGAELQRDYQPDIFRIGPGQFGAYLTPRAVQFSRNSEAR